MNCCCVPEQQPTLNSPLPKYTTTQPATTANKPKFSFRDSVTSSSQVSSRNRSYPLFSSTNIEEQQLQELQKQYETLKLEQKAADEFQRNRVAALQQQVAFYQRQLRQREKDIYQLNSLFKAKLQERSMLQGRQQFVVTRQKHSDDVSTQP